MPFPSLYVSIGLEFLSGTVALLVSYYAFHYTRLIENSRLRFIGIGFLLLGLGLLAEASIVSMAVLLSTDVFANRLIALESATAFSFLQVVAYLLIMLGYTRRESPPQASSLSNDGSKSTASLLIALPVLAITGYRKIFELIHFSREVIVLSSVLSVAFLIMIVIQDATSYKENRNKVAMLVLSSFVLILLAEILSLVSALMVSVTLNLIGTVVQFVGFLTLLVFLLARSRIGSTREASQ